MLSRDHLLELLLDGIMPSRYGCSSFKLCVTTGNISKLPLLLVNLQNKNDACKVHLTNLVLIIMASIMNLSGVLSSVMAGDAMSNLMETQNDILWLTLKGKF